MKKDLINHAPELARAIANHQYETVGDGSVLLTKQKLFLRGMYKFRTNGGDWEFSPNLIPTEGINYILDSFVSSHAAIPLYLSLYAGVISPTALWTASNYASTASEVTTGAPEGYTQSTRVVWTAAAAAAGAKANAASPANFTIVTATSLAVNGAGLHTASAKGATTGALISATRFGSARAFANTDVFEMEYELDGTSS